MIRRIYKDAGELLFKYKWVILGIAVLFFVSLFVGFFLPAEMKKTLLASMLETLAEAPIEGEAGSMFRFIFFNNLLVAAMLLLFGVTIVLPVMIVATNGFFVGVILDIIVRSIGVETGIVRSTVIGLVPHGIFEIPAIIFAATGGMIFGLKMFFAKRFFKDQARFHVFKRVIMMFLSVVVPLLFVAAVVESTVTPWLIDKSLRPIVEAQESHPELAPLLLTEDDVRRLGVDAEYISLLDAQEQVTGDDQAAALGNLSILFDEEVYVGYKTIRTRPQVRRLFDGEEASLSIDIFRFDSALEAETSVIFYRDIFYPAINGDTEGVAIEQEGEYFFLLQLSGGDDEMLTAVVAAQRARLATQ